MVMIPRKIICVAGINVMRNTQKIEQDPAPHPYGDANELSGSAKD
jgi:hypothetical protein